MFETFLESELAEPTTDACAGSGSGFGAVKLLRIVRLVRLAKVMRVLKLQRMLRKLQHALLINPAAMQLGQIFAFILFFMHLMGCMWFFATQDPTLPPLLRSRPATTIRYPPTARTAYRLLTAAFFFLLLLSAPHFCLVLLTFPKFTDETAATVGRVLTLPLFVYASHPISPRHRWTAVTIGRGSTQVGSPPSLRKQYAGR